MLELTDHALRLPHGFLRTRFSTIPYADVIRIGVRGGELTLDTEQGSYSICLPRFQNSDQFREVRESIAAKTSIALPYFDKRDVTILENHQLRPIVWRGDFPDPLVNWVAPDDWGRYRTHIVRSKPFYVRLLRMLWFFVRCWSFMLIPWILFLLVLHGYLTPTREYPLVSGAGAIFFTLLYWAYTTYPISNRTTISFRDNGITELLCNGQSWDYNYRQLDGWNVIERDFKGRTLHILLLKGLFGIRAIALSDSSVRSRVEQILSDKHVPQVLDIAPPWEKQSQPKQTPVQAEVHPLT